MQRRRASAAIATLAAALVMATACSAPPRAADLTPGQAWAITQDAYQRGCDDGTFFHAGQRHGTTLGDVGGLEGDAWRLGFDDVLNGRPQRTDAQLRDWLDNQSPYPSLQ
ncbi:MAG: hypothetical protein AAGK09_08295 [Planctomycetota bacterium]